MNGGQLVAGDALVLGRMNVLAKVGLGKGQQPERLAVLEDLAQVGHVRYGLQVMELAEVVCLVQTI